jgi:hypothetical protein
VWDNVKNCIDFLVSNQIRSKTIIVVTVSFYLWWRRFYLETLIVLQLVNKSSAFLELDGYKSPTAASPWPRFKSHSQPSFSIILLSMATSSRKHFLLRFSNIIWYSFPISPLRRGGGGYVQSTLILWRVSCHWGVFVVRRLFLTPTRRVSWYPRRVIKGSGFSADYSLFNTALTIVTTLIIVIPLGTYNSSSWYIFPGETMRPH